MRLRNLMTLASVALALFFGSNGPANAQYDYPGGYGGYGWGGWGGGHTVDGDIARGLGAYAAGEGVYNQQTAVANSINTDTVMRFNEYVYQGQMETNRRYYERRAINDKQRRDASDAIRKRVVENPETGDILNGDALNAVLDQVTDPKMGSSTLRMAKTMIPASAIKQIAFTYASEGVTFSLAQISGEDNWPLALKGKGYAAEREAYMNALGDARKKNDNGELSSDEILKVRSSLRALRDKVERNPPTEKSDVIETNRYLRGLAGFAKMLEKPSIDRPLAELDKIKEATVGDLLAFMSSFNLRFGPATTAQQRAIYTQIYPILAETRDKTLGQAPSTVARANANANPDAPKPHPIDFFQGIPNQHLHDDKKN